MKNTRLKRILNGLLCLVLAVTLGTAVGTTLGKYVFSGTVGAFGLNIVPRVVPAEAIMGMVPEGTLTRIVYDKWNNGYTDTGVNPAVTITADAWQNEGATYDPNQPNVRMFAKQHDGDNYTVYVLSAENIYAPKDSSYLLSGSEHGGDLENSVTEIVLHNFHFPDDTSKIANMFNGCTKLTKLDLSGMDFSHLRTTADYTTSSAYNNDRGNFFNGTNIIELNISHTKWSGHMGTFFYKLDGGNNVKLATVEKIYMTGIDTKEVTYLHAMFRGMKNLKDIIGFSDFNVSNVTNVRELFYGCHSLKPEYFVTFGNLLNQGNITTLKQTFYQCYNFNSEALCAVLGGLAGDGSALKTISLNQTFQYCNGITSVDLSTVSNVNAIDISNLYQTFYGCGSMTSITLPQISSVTTMEQTFYNCAKLQTVDMSFVNSSSLTNTQQMFAASEQLTTVYVGDGWTTAAVVNSAGMFSGCGKIVGENGTTYDANHIDAIYARIDGKDGQPGYFRSTYTAPEAADLKTKIANNKIKDKTLTKIVFDYWDPVNGYTAAGITADQWSEGINFNKHGTIKMFPKADGNNSTMYILSEKNIIAPVNSRYLFAGTGSPGNTSQSYGTMKSVKEIVLNNFYLPNGVAADHMFYNCSALTSLTFSSRWAENIQDSLNLDFAFYGCSKLTSIDISGLARSTLKNLSLNSAFYNCSALASLNFSSFSVCPLEKLSLKSAFSGCTSLSSLDLNCLAKDTLKELHFNGTFSGCSSLVSLDMSDFNFTIHSDIFDNTSFSNLSSLKTVDFSNTTWWYGNITFIWTMKTVESINFTNVNTEQVNNMADVFNGWSNLREIVGIADFDTGKLENLGETFKGCSSLGDEYFAEFAQALAKGNSVTNLSYAFSGCTKMSNESFKAIIRALNTVNTKKVTTVTGAFSTCTGLSGVLDMSGFDMTGVTKEDRETMFTGCTKVTSIIWPDTEAASLDETDLPEETDPTAEEEETPPEKTDSPAEEEVTLPEKTDSPAEEEETPPEKTDPAAEEEETPPEKTDPAAEEEETPPDETDSSAEEEVTPPEETDPSINGEDPAAA